ncbi:sucrose-6-phosphate hydrolase [Tetragenococcus halophilus]|uniref:Sucrose-6-phosphate hydrolase n=1 Tax=Tetragenococcus halophilus TaxID=51669 RepID=A0A3G5FM41_TETHA|nr:glycoside hydrolase family 32 protein [Tetragenococcus halophilus]AYW51420.1 sucrose-6-phosphate hydrolase [Tetragenococcus halophilus]GBD64584.1 hypothetical protein TEHD23766T_2011 [Tetragenococcus halophilus subsp. flandriensis]
MSLLNKNFWKELSKKQEFLKEKMVDDFWRLHYHQMPETGWLNDPNGVCQFKGKYHLYHQYVPDSPISGVGHWAHKTSDDLVHFKEEDIFLSPEHEYEKDGVYSGSAFVKDDEIHYFYTGNVKKTGDYDYIFDGREQNTVHVVSKNGYTIDYQEVVIKHEEYPKRYTSHIRDPKVFEHNEKYYMILGTRTIYHTGEILLYESEDLYKWNYKGTFFGNRSDMGFMWECPDYFELKDQSILLFSPQGILKKEHQFQNVYQTGYFIGRTDWENVVFEPQSSFKELDYGFDFYAPQTFEDEQGRRILWGWMGIGDTKPEYTNPTISRGWQHSLTLPRELTIEDGKLKQRPLPEYQKIRKNKKQFEIPLTGEYKNKELTCEVTELLIDLKNINGRFDILLRQDTMIHYENNILELRHGRSGAGRSVRSIEINDLNQIHLFSDTSSLELFINNGSYVMSSRIYPEAGENKIKFIGKADIAVQKWDLNKTTE